MSPRIFLTSLDQPNVFLLSLSQPNVIQTNNQPTFKTLRVGDYVSVNSTNNDSTQYRFVIKINDNDDIINVRLIVDTTIINVNKENLKVIPIHSITGSFRTRSTRILLPSLDQPIITQVNNNDDNQLQHLSYDDILRKSLGWRYGVGKKLHLADLLNTNTNKSKGWMVEVEKKRKGQSVIASKIKERK